MLKKFEGERKKQLLFLGAAAVLLGGGVLLITELMSSGKSKQEQKSPPPKIETPPPKKIEEESFKKEYGERLAVLEKQLEEMKKAQEQQQQQTTGPLGVPKGQTQPTSPQPSPPSPPPPPPPPPPPSHSPTSQQYPPVTHEGSQRPKGPSRPVDLIAIEKKEVKKEEERSEEKKPEEKKLEVKEEVKAEKKKSKALIPAGAFVKGVLLSGLDAPTGGKAQTSPHPVLIRLVDKAILPNLYKSDIRDCFVIGSGYGDLSAERAYVRLEAISCVKEGGEVVERRISGYVSGEDGKVGLLGRVVTKQGAILARMLVAGFIEGIGRVFQQSSTTVVMSPSGTLSTIDPKQAFQAGITGGFSEAAKTLVEQYKKLADETYPVVEINAGRRVDVVFLQSFSLDDVEGDKVIKPEHGLNKPPPDPAAPIQ
jgi:conjugal transfer pilus assembly protein TraB